MGGEATRRLGLVVRSAPYRGRSGRDQLDVALAAAAMGWELELVFLGAGELHLHPGQRRDKATLPPGVRAWASLPELTEVHAWVAPGAARRLGLPPDALLVPCRVAGPTELQGRLARCDRTLVL